MSFNKMRFFRVLTLSALTFLASSYSQASLYFTGPYAGIGVGAGFLKGDQKISTTATSNPAQAKVKKVTPSFLLNLGMMTELGTSTFMGGIEAYIQRSFGSAHRTVTDDRGAQTRINLKFPNNYGIALKFGKLINPKILAYGRVAFEISPGEKRLVPGMGMKMSLADFWHVGLEAYITTLGKKQVRKDNPNLHTNIQSKFTEYRLFLTLTYQISSPLKSSRTYTFEEEVRGRRR